MPRLFLAAWPPTPVAERLASLPRPELPGVRWLPEESWHVTLRFLGDSDIDEVAATLDRVALPHSTAVLGPALRPLGKRMLVVPVAGLDPLALAVTAATAHVGRPPNDRPFTGHLTLARLRHRVPRSLPVPPIDDSFEVDHVRLVRSELSSNAATYHTVARFPTT